jgi:hypothetical protein
LARKLFEYPAEGSVRLVLINSDVMAAAGLVRWLTPLALVTLAESAEEVIACLDRGEHIDRVVVCAGNREAFAGGFHAALMSRHHYMAPRLLYVSTVPLPHSIALDGAATIVARALTPHHLSAHLSAMR